LLSPALAERAHVVGVVTDGIEKGDRRLLGRRVVPARVSGLAGAAQRAGRAYRDGAGFSGLTCGLLGELHSRGDAELAVYVGEVGLDSAG
jgi:hypothetical protein